MIVSLCMSLLRLGEASAKGTWKQSLAATATVVPIVEPPTPAFSRAFPDGSTVSLVQVSKADAGGSKTAQKTQRSYWKPDGTRLAGSILPSAWDKALHLARNMPSERQFEFAFVFSGLNEDQAPTVESTRGGEFAVQAWMGKIAGQNLKVCASDEPANQHLESFRIGVACKNWAMGERIPLSRDRGPAASLDADMKRLAYSKGLPHFGRAYTYDPHDSTFDLLLAAPAAGSSQQRILLFDKHDQLLSPGETMSASGTNYIWKTLKADRATAQRAAYAVIETRPYSYVTIDHVTLVPRGEEK